MQGIKVLCIYTHGKILEAHIGHTQGIQGIWSYIRDITHNHMQIHIAIGSEGYIRHIQEIQGIWSHMRITIPRVIAYTQRTVRGIYTA